MAGGDGTTLVMITHQKIDQREVEDVLRRRWPDVVPKDLAQEEPAVAMSPSDDSVVGGWNRYGS
jgi:hypothetical protein